MHLIFWQQMASPIQSPVIRALAEVPGVMVHWIVDSFLENWRVSLGWQVPAAGQAVLIENPQDNLIDELTDPDKNETIHIISTDRGSRSIREAMKSVVRKQCRFGLMSETADLRGAYGFLRYLLGRLKGVRLSRKIDFTLAIGSNGVRWHEMCGFPIAKIFPYAYFTEYPHQYPDQPERSLTSRVTQLLFVGRCIHRKGVDILLSALAGVQHCDWHLSVIGDGFQLSALKKLAIRLGIQNHITFCGSLPNSEVMNIMYKSDLMVLPSRWDGWGAVINEALMRGLPVICSDACGAKDLLDGKVRGSVFKANSLDSLKTTLTDWLTRERDRSLERQTLHRWSSCITGDHAAKYILGVIDCVYKGSPRPQPPWLAS